LGGGGRGIFAGSRVYLQRKKARVATSGKEKGPKKVRSNRGGKTRRGAGKREKIAAVPAWVAFYSLSHRIQRNSCPWNAALKKKTKAKKKSQTPGEKNGGGSKRRKNWTVKAVPRNSPLSVLGGRVIEKGPRRRREIEEKTAEEENRKNMGRAGGSKGKQTIQIQAGRKKNSTGGGLKTRKTIKTLVQRGTS